eukprot:403367749
MENSNSNVKQDMQQTFNPPNNDFYEKYGGSMGSPLIMSSPLFFIRHAVSEYNHQILSLHEEAKSITDKQEKHQRYLEFNSRRDLIDPLLHSTGLKQAQDQQEFMNQFNYRLIFVSPHRRTLMTAINILKSYQPLSSDDKLQSQTKIKLILLPLAKEILNNSNDLACSHEELRQFCNEKQLQNPQFEFDFSQFEQFQNEYGVDSWYYQILTNSEKKQMLLDQIRDTNTDAITIGIKTIIENNGERIETHAEVYDRSLMLKKYLNQVIEKEIQNRKFDCNEKILVVSHSRIMEAFFSEGYDSRSSMFVNARRFLNCEVVPYQYETAVKDESLEI